jgi:hypothetical protein
MATIRIDNVTSLLLTGLGVAALGVGILNIHKANKVLEKVDMSVDEIAKKTEIEVERTFIDNTVTNLVEKRYDDTVKSITKDVTAIKLDDIDKKIHDAVEKAVDEQLEELKPMVEEKLKKKLKAIDIDDVKADVLSEIKDESRLYLRRKINGITSRNFMGLL